MKHRLTFVTLTIPVSAGLLSPRQGYDLLLSHFLQWLRRTEKVVTYVWKAERMNNGQLHYHITTPTWIHYQKIKDKWNNLMRSNGLLQNFEKQYGHSNPNSTDVHEVHKLKDLSAYLVKEFCKAIQNFNDTNGKIWDASDNLKTGEYFSIEMTQRHELILQEYRKNKNSEEYIGERFVVVKMDDQRLWNLLSNEEKGIFRDFLLRLRREVKNDLFTPGVIDKPGIKTLETAAENLNKMPVVERLLTLFD